MLCHAMVAPLISRIFLKTFNILTYLKKNKNFIILVKLGWLKGWFLGQLWEQLLPWSVFLLIWDLELTIGVIVETNVSCTLELSPFYCHLNSMPLVGWYAIVVPLQHDHHLELILDIAWWIGWFQLFYCGFLLLCHWLTQSWFPWCFLTYLT